MPERRSSINWIKKFQPPSSHLFSPTISNPYTKKKLHISLILLGAVALSSCSKPNPNQKDVETQIKLALPPWLDVSVAKQDVLEPRENELAVSYEVQISPKEDIYVPDYDALSKTTLDLADLLAPDDSWLENSSSEMEATQMVADTQMLGEELAKIHLIKVAVSAGQQTRIYGKIGATRTGKTFQFSTPQIETQSPVFTAKPKSSYPDTLVTESPEHKAAMEQITKKIKAHQAEARLKKEKRLAEIRSAFAAGKTYQAAYAAALLMLGSKKEARAAAFAAKAEANAQKHAPPASPSSSTEVDPEIRTSS